MFDRDDVCCLEFERGALWPSELVSPLLCTGAPSPGNAGQGGPDEAGFINQIAVIEKMGKSSREIAQFGSRSQFVRLLCFTQKTGSPN